MCAIKYTRYSSTFPSKSMQETLESFIKFFKTDKGHASRFSIELFILKTLIRQQRIDQPKKHDWSDESTEKLWHWIHVLNEDTKHGKDNRTLRVIYSLGPRSLFFFLFLTKTSSQRLMAKKWTLRRLSTAKNWTYWTPAKLSQKCQVSFKIFSRVCKTLVP